jgi:hypothetical protein
VPPLVLGPAGPGSRGVQLRVQGPSSVRSAGSFNSLDFLVKQASAAAAASGPASGGLPGLLPVIRTNMDPRGSATGSLASPRAGSAAGLLVTPRGRTQLGATPTAHAQAPGEVVADSSWWW